MNYEDFPILNDETYNLMRSEYSNQPSFNRNQHIQKILTLINRCKSISLPASLNLKIKTIVEKLLKILENIEKNLKIIENFNNFSQKTSINFNLFEFFNIFLNILFELNSWKTGEHKDYYSSIISRSEQSIMLELISAMEILKGLNITIFKHM